MQANNHNDLLISGLLLGAGMGGFVDGILFHQILQTHAMLSNIITPNTVVNIEVNMFWDGVFHAFTWFMTAAGIVFLWRAKNIPKKGLAFYFIGFILIGFGAFNIIEGLINHFILQLHHVIQRTSISGQFASDVVFLILSFFIILCGIILLNKSHKY